MNKKLPDIAVNKTVEELTEDILRLNNEEEKEMKEGQFLYEMDKNNPGWQIVKRWLEDMAYHAWVDPRTIESTNGRSSQDEWMWQELNAFHAAAIAKEVLENIEKASSRAEYLHKLKTGEIKRQTLKI